MTGTDGAQRRSHVRNRHSAGVTDIRYVRDQRVAVELIINQLRVFFRSGPGRRRRGAHGHGLTSSTRATAASSTVITTTTATAATAAATTTTTTTAAAHTTTTAHTVHD